jgi:hypothetical protein
VKRSAMVSKRATAMTVTEPRRSPRAPMALTRARVGLSGAKKKTARLIAKNPFRVVAGALALGFAFAKLKTIF